jgi:hypothetical protein
MRCGFEQSEKSYKTLFSVAPAAAVGRVRSPVVAFLWVDMVTSAYVGRTSGAEKFRPPPQKYFFDSIDPKRL